jgi:hypothetical protein
VHPKLHEAPATPPTERKRYPWGTLDLWVRKPGECISTGYMSIHRAGCWNDRHYFDDGSIFYRAVGKDGALIVGALEEGTLVGHAIRRARAYAANLIAGQERPEANQRAKRAAGPRPALEPGADG